MLQAILYNVHAGYVPHRLPRRKLQPKKTRAPPRAKPKGEATTPRKPRNPKKLGEAADPASSLAPNGDKYLSNG